MAVNIAMKILFHLKFFSSIKTIHINVAYPVLIAQTLHLHQHPQQTTGF